MDNQEEPKSETKLLKEKGKILLRDFYFLFFVLALLFFNFLITFIISFSSLWFAFYITIPILIIALIFTSVRLVLKAKIRLSKKILLSILAILFSLWIPAVIPFFISPSTILITFPLEQLSLKLKSAVPCMLIPLPAGAKVNCYHELALTTNNPSFCGMIAKEGDASYISGRGIFIERAGTWRSICYAELAETLKDEALCREVDPSDNRGGCYDRVGIVKQDETLCEGTECFLEIAAAKKDTAICDEYWSSNPYGKDNCYSKVAVAKLDVVACGNLTFSDNRDDCYKGIAIKNKDVSLCEKIINDYDKEICASSVFQK